MHALVMTTCLFLGQTAQEKAEATAALKAMGKKLVKDGAVTLVQAEKGKADEFCKVRYTVIGPVFEVKPTEYADKPFKGKLSWLVGKQVSKIYPNEERAEKATVGEVKPYGYSCIAVFWWQDKKWHFEAMGWIRNESRMPIIPATEVKPRRQVSPMGIAWIDLLGGVNPDIDVEP